MQKNSVMPESLQAAGVKTMDVHLMYNLFYIIHWHTSQFLGNSDQQYSEIVHPNKNAGAFLRFDFRAFNTPCFLNSEINRVEGIFPLISNSYPNPAGQI